MKNGGERERERDGDGPAWPCDSTQWVSNPDFVFRTGLFIG